jgi:7-cyano-7-deazaguanine synthase
MTAKAIVLCSGGLDSTTCLAVAKHDGFNPIALSFDYGQRHKAELLAAKRVASHLGAERHIINHLSLNDMGGSALTDANIAVPDHQASDTIPVTYVPARNTIFLSIALGWAETLDCDAIYIGVSHVDYSGYPDCRPEFIEAFTKMAAIANKRGVEGRPIQIVAPLLELSKAQTIQLGQQLGVDYSLTVTCYQADNDGSACGRCDACVLRSEGFQAAGLSDPTRYQSTQR